MKKKLPLILSFAVWLTAFGNLDSFASDSGGIRSMKKRIVNRNSSIPVGYNSGWNQNELFGCYNNDYDDRFCFAYNRVDGLFLGIQRPRRLYRRHGIFQLYGMAGIAFETNRFQYHVALERSFFPAYMQFAVGAETFDLTYSEDNWMIPSLENSLAALLIHEDYHDFYRRRGQGGFVSQQFTRNARLKVGYYEEEHLNLLQETDWALFGGRKTFRINPAIEEMTLRGILGHFRIDTRNRIRATRRGWLVNLVAEFFPSEFKSDSDFKRYILDIRRYQPISRGENLNIRIRAGETEGIVPIQKHFDLGGISSLRAYEFKAFTGDRMILGNIEYHVNWDRLHWYPDILFFDDFNFILFADAGLAWYKKDKDFRELHHSDLFSDVGIALATEDGSLRLNIAKRLDRSVDAIRVTFRISRPF
jgi:outer membrane protein assembly factor BamA